MPGAWVDKTASLPHQAPTGGVADSACVNGGKTRSCEGSGGSVWGGQCSCLSMKDLGVGGGGWAREEASGRGDAKV